MGDVVNLSQRLQEWARPGEVVFSEPTLQALGNHLEAEHLGPWPVKGSQQPVAAYRVRASDLSLE